MVRQKGYAGAKVGRYSKGMGYGNGKSYGLKVSRERYVEPYFCCSNNIQGEKKKSGEFPDKFHSIILLHSLP